MLTRKARAEKRETAGKRKKRERGREEKALIRVFNDQRKAGRLES